MPYNYQKHREIGQAIRALRVAQGLSQRETARRIGVDHSYLLNVEKGIKAPSSRLLSEIEARLGWDITGIKALIAGRQVRLVEQGDVFNVDLSLTVDADGECRRAALSWAYRQGATETDDFTIRVFPSRDRKLINVDRDDKSLSLTYKEECPPTEDYIEINLSHPVTKPGNREYHHVELVPGWGTHSVVQQFIGSNFSWLPEYPDYPVMVFLRTEPGAAPIFEFSTIAGAGPQSTRGHPFVFTPSSDDSDECRYNFRMAVRSREVFGIQWKRLNSA